MSALFRATRTADFDRLYRHHAASVYRYAFAVLGNQADAEDVTQQTFMNAYRSIAQGTKPRKAENWLLTIAHNEVRRHFRRNQGVREVELDEQLAHPDSERSDPSLADVLRGLQHLPPSQRSALVMREFEGRSYAEIAQALDVTQSALETLLFRARRQLAEYLEGALTCAEAEQAFSRRLDGRLPRRETRHLKAHLRECPLCVRFANAQKRQRSLLKGLSIMPIPASLFLFRGEQAAAAGLSGSAFAAGGSAALGGGAAAAGTGATGIATAFVVKAAAVTAAVGVAGGVGYGVATAPDTVTKAERKVAHAAVVAEKGQRRLVAEARVDQPGRARTQPARAQWKAAKVKARRAKPAPRAKSLGRVKGGAAGRAREQAPLVVKARPTARAVAKKPKPVLPRARARPEAGKRLGHTRPARPKPPRPAHDVEKPSRPTEPESPTGRGPKK